MQRAKTSMCAHLPRARLRQRAAQNNLVIESLNGLVRVRVHAHAGHVLETASDSGLWFHRVPGHHTIALPLSSL
jgi:hypothetical protein